MIFLRPKQFNNPPFSRVFDPSRDNRAGMFYDGWMIALRKKLRRRGYELKTIDSADWETICKAEIILFMGFHDDVYYRRCLDEGLRDKMVYFELEFPLAVKSTEGGYASRQYLDSFSKVLTWNKSLVEGKYSHTQFLYMRRPNSWYRKPIKGVAFSDRGSIVSISTNKDADIPEELYSERKRAIRFFQEHLPERFGLYGSGWDRSIGRYIKRKLGMKVNASKRASSLSNGLARLILGETDYSKCWRGWTDNVFETYADYRFALIYECSSWLGAVSDKIFECLQASCVPIYLGAPDISEIVPQECFVNKRNFTYEQLLDIMTTMPESVWRRYIDAGKAFLATSDGKRNFEDDWAREFVEVMLS